ncbi:MAG: hypothetical protein AB7U82_29920 [Blastocatellales bacterium]
MKPGSKDKQYRILITGRELEELQQFTWQMAESFGLDRRIENYRGKRPIGLYSWELDCLDAVINSALEDNRVFPQKAGPGYEALQQLSERLKQLDNQDR